MQQITRRSGVRRRLRGVPSACSRDRGHRAPRMNTGQRSPPAHRTKNRRAWERWLAGSSNPDARRWRDGVPATADAGGLRTGLIGPGDRDHRAIRDRPAAAVRPLARVRVPGTGGGPPAALEPAHLRAARRISAVSSQRCSTRRTGSTFACRWRVAINVGIALHVFLAGWFTYFWVRHRGIHPVAAVAGRRAVHVQRSVLPPHLRGPPAEPLHDGLGTADPAGHRRLVRPADSPGGCCSVPVR